jgi:hypothetical protein
MEEHRTNEMSLRKNFDIKGGPKPKYPVRLVFGVFKIHCAWELALERKTLRQCLNSNPLATFHR